MTMRQLLEAQAEAYQVKVLRRDCQTSLFELIIRGVGGLLSAYDLSHDRLFLDKCGHSLLRSFAHRLDDTVLQQHHLDVCQCQGPVLHAACCSRMLRRALPSRPSHINQPTAGPRTWQTA